MNLPVLFALLGVVWGSTSAIAQEVARDLDLTPELLRDSPVLRRWLEEPPDLLQDIYHRPSFRTKLRLGLSSEGQNWGIDASVEDVFVGRSPVTLSARYQGAFSGRESGFGAQVRYYLLPLGSYFNVAPLVGWRSLDRPGTGTISGVEVGLQAILALSPQSADLRLSHTFTAPSSQQETSITTVAVSYALTGELRLGSRLEWRRSPLFDDYRVGILLDFAL